MIPRQRLQLPFEAPCPCPRDPTPQHRYRPTWPSMAQDAEGLVPVRAALAYGLILLLQPWLCCTSLHGSINAALQARAGGCRQEQVETGKETGGSAQMLRLCWLAGRTYNDARQQSIPAAMQAKGAANKPCFSTNTHANTGHRLHTSQCCIDPCVMCRLSTHLPIG